MCLHSVCLHTQSRVPARRVPAHTMRSHSVRLCTVHTAQKVLISYKTQKVTGRCVGKFTCLHTRSAQPVRLCIAYTIFACAISDWGQNKPEWLHLHAIMLTSISLSSIISCTCDLTILTTPVPFSALTVLTTHTIPHMHRASFFSMWAHRLLTS